MKPNYLEIGKRLADARKSNNLTQQSLADSIGVSTSYVKNIERGKKPSLEYILAVSERCHVNADWLLLGNQPTPSIERENEIIFDSDTRDMIDAVKFVMSDPDPDVRAWAKIQLRRAFAEYFEKAMEKKEHA